MAGLDRFISAKIYDRFSKGFGFKCRAGFLTKIVKKLTNSRLISAISEGFSRDSNFVKYGFSVYVEGL